MPRPDVPAYKILPPSFPRHVRQPNWYAGPRKQQHLYHSQHAQMISQPDSSPQIIYRQDLKMKLLHSVCRQALPLLLATLICTAPTQAQSKPTAKSTAVPKETVAEQHTDADLDVAR